ncbi:GSCOCT00014053001.2-RA-CDS [Cotesia congregata]|uniref:Gustatory receptor n=1 Tax=Cotesia congregata TaxID=51543 RepID=A0A8J2MDX1_COTCN|nr:GSCOCT00014053001.2-RA-CDS [Cotesia congregata]CAG5084168.1 gustatory receptor 70 [Cotesia congregata]
MTNQQPKTLQYTTKFDDHSYRIPLTIQYIIFKIVGLSPWTNFQRTQKKSYVIQHSLSGTLYNLALIIAYCSYFVWSYEDLIPRKDQPDSAFAKTVGNNVHILRIVATALIWIFFMMHQKLMIRILNKLAASSSLLQRCELYNFRDNHAIYWIFLSNFLVTTYLVVLEILVYKPILVPIRLIPALIHSWVLMQYSLLLDIVMKQFESIQSTILKLGDVDSDIKLHTLFVTKVPLRRQITHEITKIRDVHGKLFKITELISNFYGSPILMTIFYFGVSSVCYLYFIILSLFANDKGEITVNYYSFSSWFLIMVYGFIVMTAKVGRAIAQVMYRVIALSIYK